MQEQTAVSSGQVVTSLRAANETDQSIDAMHSCDRPLQQVRTDSAFAHNTIP